MSDIRDPALHENPTAPGDEGKSTEPSMGNEAPRASVACAAAEDDAIGNAAPGNEAASAQSADFEEDEGPQPGNEALPAPRTLSTSSEDEEESPDDSIGNRIDVPVASQSQPAAGSSKGRKKRRRGGKKVPAREPQQQAADASARRAFHVGDKVRAKIVSIGPAAVLVDLWGKERGVLDLREVKEPDGPDPRIGDGVDVVVIQDGSRGGNLVVTRDPSRAERGRELIAQAFNANDAIEGLVTGLNRGGLEVDISGVRAFCPSSQIDVRVPPTIDPKSLVLTRQAFKVTSLIDDGKEAVVSRRAIVEQAMRARAEEIRKEIKVGDVVKGTVVAVKDYGVFVDLGGIEGMIHISELSNNRSLKPQDVCKVGDEIEAKVLRISQGTPPEQPAKEETPETAEPVEPAEPAAESSPPAESKKDKKEKGKKSRRGRPEGTLPRVALSRRAIEADPWDEVPSRLHVGTVLTGKVARMQPFGAFVELWPGVDGLLHVSELGEGKRIQHPSEVLKEGQQVTVRVEKIDRPGKRISLSMLPEGVTEEQLKNSITPRVGMIVNATIAEHESFGIWAQIENTVGKIGRGLIPLSESNEPRGTDLRKALPPGTVVKVKVTEIERGRPKLSIRAALHDEERQAYRAYQKEATAKTVGVSLADKLRAKLGGLTPSSQSGSPQGR